MSTVTKVFAVLVAVLTIAASTLFISAAAQMENWRELALKYQEDRDNAWHLQINAEAAAQSALALKEEQLRERAGELARAQNQISDLKRELADAGAKLAEASKREAAAAAARDKVVALLDVTMADRNQLQKQNQVLIQQNMDLQSRNARANTRVLELTTQNTIQQDELRNLQEKLVALEKSVRERGVAAARPAADTPPGVTPVVAPGVSEIRGEIVEVKGNVASINVGDASGVLAGMVFMVYRDATYLGELTIDMVRPNESAGKLGTQVAGEIRRGDRVFYGVEQAGPQRAGIMP